MMQGIHLGENHHRFAYEEAPDPTPRSLNRVVRVIESSGLQTASWRREPKVARLQTVPSVELSVHSSLISLEPTTLSESQYEYRVTDEHHSL